MQTAPPLFFRVGGCESTIDHRRKAATIVHDLDETEGAADIDDAPERILAIRLPQLDVEARRPQCVGDLGQLAGVKKVSGTNGTVVPK